MTRLQEQQIKQEKANAKLQSSKFVKAMFIWNMKLVDKMPWKAAVFKSFIAAKK